MLVEERVVAIVVDHLESEGYRTWVHSQWKSLENALKHQIRIGGHFPDIIAKSPKGENLLGIECKGETKSGSPRGILTAFGQALAYRQATNAQIIATPAVGWSIDYKTMAESVGVGVLLVDKNDSIIQVVPPHYSTWPDMNQLQAVKQLLSLPYDASPEVTPLTTRPEPYVLALLLAEEGELTTIFKERLRTHLPGRKEGMIATTGFVKNVIRSIVSLQLLSTKHGRTNLSSWSRQIRWYFINKYGNLDSAIQSVYQDYLSNRRKGKPTPEISLIIGTTIRQHPSVSFLLSVLEEMRELQGKSKWVFPEIFEFLIENHSWETMIYLVSTDKNVPSDPRKLNISHIRSHLLDDTIRQLVHAGILGEESLPLQGSRKMGSKDVFIELL